jgi:hypothetical protein
MAPLSIPPPPPPPPPKKQTAPLSMPPPPNNGSENWKRSHEEVSALMGMFIRMVDSKTAEYKDRGIRVLFVGRRDRLPEGVVAAMERWVAAAQQLRVATCGGGGGRPASGLLPDDSVSAGRPAVCWKGQGRGRCQALPMAA